MPLYTSSAGPLRCTWPPADPDAHHTAGHLDPPGVGGAVACPLACGECGRGRAGAAGEGLPAPPLVHPHPDASDTVDHERILRHDELDVGAVRRHRCDRRAPPTGRGHRALSVSARATTTCGFPTPTASPGRATSRRRADTIASPGATTNGPEVDLVTAGHPRELAHAAARADRDRLAFGDREQPVLDQEVGEHPDAVAAHLRRTPVGVVVVHEPLGGRILGEGRCPIRHVLRSHRADDPIAADPEMAVRQCAELGTVEVDRAVGVGEQHEVIAGAVPLGESQFGAHPVSVSSVAMACCTRSAAPASIHRVFRYRPNHPT